MQLRFTPLQLLFYLRSSPLDLVQPLVSLRLVAPSLLLKRRFISSDLLGMFLAVGLQLRLQTFGGICGKTALFVLKPSKVSSNLQGMFFALLLQLCLKLCVLLLPQAIFLLQFPLLLVNALALGHQSRSHTLAFCRLSRSNRFALSRQSRCHGLSFCRKCRCCTLSLCRELLELTFQPLTLVHQLSAILRQCPLMVNLLLVRFLPVRDMPTACLFKLLPLLQ
mmetsp:Transcript_59534/g.158362  ORF Transcript_59534/g.158362 Transcript_59534/m.158362 type:complete len:222 (+) Transcript_59534:3508-4173(+)